MDSRVWSDVFKEEKAKFELAANETICTGGSCFAQRISQFLISQGLNFGQFEPPHPLLDEDDARSLGYGQYSARYGNLYTARQLRQLVEESFDVIPLRLRMGRHIDGGVVDLLRPSINRYHRFHSEQETEADRRYHLSRVRTLFLNADVYIFTLGLTESWLDAEGNAYGVHPAVVTKTTPTFHIEKVNFDYLETYNDIVQVITFLRSINPKIKFIFTVSPVGLSATHQDRHVLISTVYSKSVLRAVAGRLADISPLVDYFPSYEIFSQAQSFGQFLASDLRDVSPRGVDVTMGFFREMFLRGAKARSNDEMEMKNPFSLPQNPIKSSGNWIEVECDELMNQLKSKPDV